MNIGDTELAKIEFVVISISSRGTDARSQGKLHGRAKPHPLSRQLKNIWHWLFTKCISLV